MSGFLSARNPIIRAVAKAYQANMASKLAPFGLKYDDLLVETEDVKKALTRISPEARLERERRIKRAFDLSAKRKELPAEYQEKDPFDPYLRDASDRAKLERMEREILNGF